MHKTLQTLTLTATLGATNLFASSGVYLLAEKPDDVSQSIVYATEPNLRLNAHGYVQDDSDRFLVGWNTQQGMFHDPMNWDMSRNSLSLVKLGDSQVPVMQTGSLGGQFSFPLNDAIGTSYNHQWQVIDMNGGSHDLVATFTKNAAATWFVSLDAPDALSVNRDHHGGPLIDEANPLSLNFDGTNNLMDVSGMAGPLNVYLQWDPALSSGAPDSNVMLDFGPMGMPGATHIEDAPYGVISSYQDGSAPSKAVSAHVDGSGALQAVYADGSSQESFQLGYISLGADPSQTVVRAPLNVAEQDKVNGIFPAAAG